MWKRFFKEEKSATLLEYIVGAALALAVLGTAVWALMDAVATKGDQTRSSIESQIPTPP